MTDSASPPTTVPSSCNPCVTGLILAGGRATRMGGKDKGLIEIAGQAMVSHIVSRLRPQVSKLLINANRNRGRYERLGGCRVVADDIEDFAGPLAGMASAIDLCDSPWMLTVPCDSPFIAADLCRRLYETAIAAEADLSVAHDGERLQPVFALLRTDLGTSLREYLESGERKIDRWYAKQRMVACDLSDQALMFVNVNTPEDRSRIESQLAVDDDVY